MTSPFQLIQEFDEQERHDFKLLVKNSTHKRDSKINEFLALVYKGYTSKVICEKLYGAYPHAAFYALRKRLTHLLLEYFANDKDKELDSVENEVNLLFKAGKKLVLNKKYKLGFDCLSKALKKAEKNELIDFQESILFELIQFAHLNSTLELEQLNKHYKKVQKINRKNHLIAIGYAQVKQQLNAYFLEQNTTEILLKIEEIFSQYNISVDRDLNYRGLYQLAQLTFAKSTVSKTFVRELNDFEKRITKIVDAKQPRTAAEWTFKFKLYYLLATSNYRAKRFESSTNYLNRILKRARQNQIIIPKELYFKIMVLKALNTNYLGKNNEAQIILNDVLNSSKLAKQNKNWLNGYGALTLILFHGGKFNEVEKTYLKYTKSDEYYANIQGEEWVLRKNLIYILTQFELLQIEKAKTLLSYLQLSYSKLKKKDQRVFFFLMCIEKVISKPEYATNSHFHNFVHSKLDKKPRYQEDIFVLSFFAWLKSKMLEENVYKSTIEIVSNLDYSN